MIASPWLAYFVTLAGLFGLLLGSFLNVVTYRVPAGKSLLPSSRCPNCDAAIKPWQNVPVLSWIALRGRCASCKARISLRYPLVELGTGLTFAGIAWWWLGNNWVNQHGLTSAVLQLVALLYLAAVSIALALIDLDTFRLPNAIVLPSLVVLLTLLAAASVFAADGSLWWPLARAAIGALALALFYAALWFFWPGGMGLGDVKLAAVLGLMLAWFGWGTLIVGAFAAFVFGGVFGVALVIAGRGGRKSRIPFGPWMLLGAWFAIFAGELLANWYLRTVFAR